MCQSRTWLTAVMAGLALVSSAELARAEERRTDGHDVPEAVPAAPPTKRSGWMPAAALHTPLAIGILSEDDINQALLLMAGLDLDVSLGYRIGRTSRLAWELALGTRGTLGVVERFRLQRGDPDLPRAVEGFASYVLPLGACLDFFPESGAGWFGSVHAGAGSFSGPEFMNSGTINIAGRLAADLGWVIPLDTGSLALSARYSLLGMKRLYIDEDYNNTLQLHELSFGVTWSL